ncbi:MAG: HD domain-containing protein [Gemmatimonadetes bacterium]|nr:HD domain-containing protein [Gemmatimonadota bacterium]NNM05109.1 HD domain-containing protein [Gemmatimonadota bacterium]
MTPKDGPPTKNTALLQEQGRQLLMKLYTVLRALKLYPLENSAVQQALDELHEFAAKLTLDEGSVELRVVGDFFFYNETRLRLDLSNYSTFGSFAQTVTDHGVGAIEVLHGIDRAEWAPFLSLFVRDPGEEDPYVSFMDRMAGAPILHLQVIPSSEVKEPELEEEALDAAKRTYAQSVSLAKEALTDFRMGKAVNVRKVKRAVQGIVDQVLADETSMITMTTLRDYDEYTFTHSVNVCIFSVLIGDRLGLTKLQLYELGLGALFHDLGKSRIDVDIINKPGGLNDDEWFQLQQHPTEGLLSLFHFHGFPEMPYRQMLMAYEHHMRLDLAGYPKNRRPRKPTLFSRIVAVADSFDAGTSIRSYQYEPNPPDLVLAEMRDNPKRGQDPLLVKALINATGVYPIGTLVILDSMEMAVVSAVSKDPEKLHKPMVKVISDSLGVPLAEPVTLDLSAVDPGTGAPPRNIIKTTDPEKYGVRVSDYLV